MTLPSKSDYPDYYKIIKNPIAIDWIQARIDSTYYKSVADFHRDYNLMFSNAMTYNEEGSDVYMDALELKQAFENALAANLKNGQIVITPEDIEAAKAAAVKPVEVAKPDLAPSPKKKPVAKKPAVKKRRVSDYESDGSESEVEIEEPVRKKVKESEFLPSLAHLPPKNF